jgi:phospholipid transport system substrate-binding protein
MTYSKVSPIALALAAALLAPVAALAPAAAQAQAATTQGSPSKLVLDNSTRVLRTLEARRAEFTDDRAALDAFIRSEFEQMFDEDYAARLVLGRHGRGAADAEVALFADALSDSLMSRYGASLLSFEGGLKTRVKSETPLRGGAIMRVSSEFIRANGETVPVDYLMRKSGGQWKVFDVLVEGVSFVQTFRTQFDGPLGSKSIAQVAADLKAGRISARAD